MAANKFFDPQVKIGWVLSLLLVIVVKAVLAYAHDQQQDVRMAHMDTERAALLVQIDHLRNTPCPAR